MRKSLFWLVPVSVVLMSGCHTAYYYSEFIKPSNVYVPAEVYRVGLIDRSASVESTVPIYIGGVPYSYMKEVPKRTSEKTLELLTKRVEDIGRYKIVPIPYDYTELDSRKFPSPMLPARVVDSLATAYDVDGLISLDGNEMVIRTRGDVDVVTVSDDMGVPIRVPEFTKESHVSLSVFWRIYDARTPRVLDEYQQSYQRVFNRVAYSENEINEMRPEDMRLIDVAGEAAADYYDRISPHWVGAYRTYYRSGSSELTEIGNIIEYQGDWEKAAERWKALTQKGDDATRYKAMYNMAVASEMLGQPRVAKEWIEKAIELKSTGMARKYLETIKEQILIYDVVNRQLGLE